VASDGDVALIDWNDAFTELAGFFLSFFATGAIGFRYVVLRPVAKSDPALFAAAARRAAIFGAIGALGTFLMFVLSSLPRLAARNHTSLAGAIVSSGPTTILFVALLFAVVGLLLVLSRVSAGWPIAALGVVVGPFANLFFGDWNRSINPIHRLAGGFWIGTLFMLVVAGIALARNGAVVSEMVHAFSPLALTSFGVLAFTGVNTAWRHLKQLSNLWTTPYGYALITKLCVVLVVVALGAWNWRRQRPLLGTEAAAAVLRRSATAELTAATVVLLITAVLVALPAP
jgi:copper transport protein